MRRTLILRDEARREQVEEKLRAMKLNLVPAAETPVLTDMFRQIWMAPDRKSAIQYVEDSFTQVTYFSVRGQSVPTLCKRLHAALPVWKRDDLLKHALDVLADGSDDQRGRVAMQVAAQMGDDPNDYDAAAAGVLTAFLKMDEPATRLSGIHALRCMPWPIFRESARQYAGDADPAVAEAAQAWLARIVELHGE